ncbi:MAG: hypothetical protein R2742_12890 [Micropruina glycogenica]
MGEPRLFSSLADIERWLGHPLTTQQATALESGALGLFAPAEGKVAISPVEGRWVDLEPVQIDAPKEWAANYGGILLEPAVSRLRLKKVNEKSSTHPSLQTNKYLWRTPQPGWVSSLDTLSSTSCRFPMVA